MSAEDYIKDRKKLVDERRRMLDRVQLMPEHQRNIRPLSDAREPVNRGRRLEPGDVREVHAHPGDTPLAHQDAPQSEAMKEDEEKTAEIPRDKHGVPNFPLPKRPEVPRTADGVPDFKLRTPPAPIRDEASKDGDGEEADDA